jgi:hypothetical protein
MEKFVLEIDDWGSWDVVKDFAERTAAERYGLEQFPQNEWRVRNRLNGRVVHKHDPFQAIQKDASNELHRFKENDRWRQIFAEKRAREVRERQERERLAEINARQQLGRVQRQGQATVRQGHVDILSEQWWDRETSRENVAAQKVDWKREGF